MTLGCRGALSSSLFRVLICRVQVTISVGVGLGDRCLSGSVVWAVGKSWGGLDPG